MKTVDKKSIVFATSTLIAIASLTALGISGSENFNLISFNVKNNILLTTGIVSSMLALGVALEEFDGLNKKDQDIDSLFEIQPEILSINDYSYETSEFENSNDFDKDKSNLEFLLQ